MNYHHWVPDYNLYRAFFDRTAETVDWLESIGVEFSHVQALGDSYPCWHIYKGSKHPGIEFMESMAKAGEKVDLKIETDLAGKKLLLDDEGKVAGLLAVRSNDTVVKIEARAVIIGTGGYANNLDMTSYFTGNPPEFFNVAGTLGRDADGIKMAYNAGANLAKSPGTVQVTGPVCRGSKWGMSVAATSLQPILWVNQNAKRYIGEDMTLKNFTFSGTAMLNQERVIAICTQKMIDRFASGEGIYYPVGVYALQGETLPGLLEEIERLKGDSIFVASTIRELAQLVDLDADVLNDTVNTYNEYCTDGIDPDFFKASEVLIALKEEDGPYYAFECQDNYPTTCGGLRITPQTEVVDKEGKIIPGLYAGGCDTGGFFGDAYDVGIAAGSTAAWAINSGRIAAEQAADYLGS
jgi:fumarate reductase flavoprotein subunit